MTAEIIHLGDRSMRAVCGAPDKTAIRTGLQAEVNCRDCLRVGSETTAETEVIAMQAAAAALRLLSRDARGRVLRWLEQSTQW